MAGGPQDLSELEQDPRLFLYTSLTAGSSHIVTATSRIETILRANRIPFMHIDTATNEKAKRLWVRRAGKRKLPALVKDGFVIGDLEQIEEWNEFGEIKEAIGPCPPAGAPVAPPSVMLPVKPTATAGTTKISTPAPKASKAAAPEKQQPIALPGAAEIAARNNPLPKSSPEDAVKPETMTSAPAEKEKSIAAATAAAKSEDKKYDHLSAPASALASGTATPAEKENKKEVEKKDVEKKDVEKKDVEKKDVEKKDVEKKDVEKKDVEKKDVEKKEVEKKDEKKEESSSEESSPVPSIGKSRYEHLSVPASAMHSGTASPVESEMGMENAFKETPTKEEAEKVFPDIASVAAGVQDLQLGEGKTVNKQEAKKAEDAVKSVED
ncbi:hypothetical protein Q7P35_007104 [Cladosporium inversicolor]